MFLFCWQYIVYLIFWLASCKSAIDTLCFFLSLVIIFVVLFIMFICLFHLFGLLHICYCCQYWQSAFGNKVNYSLAPYSSLPVKNCFLTHQQEFIEIFLYKNRWLLTCCSNKDTRSNVMSSHSLSKALFFGKNHNIHALWKCWEMRMCRKLWYVFLCIESSFDFSIKEHVHNIFDVEQNIKCKMMLDVDINKIKPVIFLCITNCKNDDIVVIQNVKW